jgi:hypothetical protein
MIKVNPLGSEFPRSKGESKAHKRYASYLKALTIYTISLIPALWTYTYVVQNITYIYASINQIDYSASSTLVVCFRMISILI